MSIRTVRRKLTVLTAVAGLVLLWGVTGAEASTFAFKCSGKGPQNAAQEYEPASCAVAPGQKRVVEGVLRNDRGKPVAGKLVVTFSTFIPAGNGAYDVTPQHHVEIQASAAGKFKIPVTAPSTETELFIEAVGDEAKEISALTQEVEIRRYITATAKVLGHGRVQIKVKGATGPVKVGLSLEGYPPPGGALRKAKNGVAVFSLGALHGTLGIIVEAGPNGDLYYVDAKSFKL